MRFGYAKWILVIMPIVSSIIRYFSDDLNDIVALIFLIILIAFYVYMMTAYYKLYKMYSDKAVIMEVITVILPFLSSVFVFAIRNHTPKMDIN